MEAALKLWAVILAVGALNYLSRLSFIALFARRTMPPLLARALRYVPAAMLTALILPMVVDSHGDGRRFRHAARRRGADRDRGRVRNPQHAGDARRRHGRAVAAAVGVRLISANIAASNGFPDPHPCASKAPTPTSPPTT